MRTYRKHFKMSEVFPVTVGDTWVVSEGSRAAERWDVVIVRRSFFVAEITEFFPVGDPAGGRLVSQ